MNTEIDDILNDFQDEVSDDKEEALVLLDIYVQRQMVIEDWIEKVEKNLAKAKKNLAVYSEKKIPDILEKHNLIGSTIKHNGNTVTVTPVICGTIRVEDRPQAFKWLEEKGFGDLIDIKLEMNFKPDESEYADSAEELMEAEGYEFKKTKGIHHSRLNSFVKKTIEAENEKGVQEFPRKLFNVFETFKTKIER